MSVSTVSMNIQFHPPVPNIDHIFSSFSYFFYEFNAPKVKIPAIGSELMRDADVVKHTLIPLRMDFDPVRTTASTANPQIDYDACTFDEENRHVPER